MMFDDEGNPQKYSQMALASLINCKQKITSDLLRYKYARIPETGVQETGSMKPMQVIMTGNNASFEAAKIQAIDITERPMKGDDE
jgi:hypothetical protein